MKVRFISGIKNGVSQEKALDNFETAIRRRKQTKGIIVAFSFGKGAYEEIARAQNHDNIEIKALSVKEMLKNENPTDSKQTAKSEQHHF
jgi:hypothetical protein